jgi:hypothetical protein
MLVSLISELILEASIIYFLQEIKFNYSWRDFGMQEKEARREEKLRFTCKCSFLEIYNEQILDLLDPSSNNLQVWINFLKVSTN